MPHKTKLTDEQVAEIHSSKETAVAIARRMGVSPSAIGAIRTGRNRRSVVLDDAARFWAKVDKGPDDAGHGTTGCWLWTGAMIARGYGKFGIWRAGRQRMVQAHRYAWELAYGPIPEGLLGCHYCDEPRCCRVEPLGLLPGGCGHIFTGGYASNSADMAAKGRAATGARHGSRTHPETVPRGSRNGMVLHPEARQWGDRNWTRRHPDLVPRGEAHGRALLTEAMVREIITGVTTGESQVALAERFGVSASAVNGIISGENWKSLGVDLPAPKLRKEHTSARASARTSGANNPRTVLSETEARNIRRRDAAGETAAAIATDLGRSRSLVYDVIRRRSWKHLP